MRARCDTYVGTAVGQAAELEGVPYDYDAATDDATPETLATGLLEWLARHPTPAAVRRAGPVGR